MSSPSQCIYSQCVYTGWSDAIGREDHCVGATGANAELLARIVLDPSRQLVGAQCSGTLLLAKLGLVGQLPACTNLKTKPWVVEAGVNGIDAPFVAHGNVATAGGCLASQYLAAWMICRGASRGDAEQALHHVAPVGEKARYVEHALGVVTPFIASAPKLVA